MQITATSAEGFAELQIVDIDAVVAGLDTSQSTTQGNKTAFLNFLSQAVVAIQEGDTADAIKRSNGCALRGTADGNGKSRDWITDCASQIAAYGLLHAAREALIAHIVER